MRILSRGLKPKFHYGDFPETSPGKFRGIRHNGIWAKADFMGLPRTGSGRRGDVGIVEFGL